MDVGNQSPGELRLQRACEVATFPNRGGWTRCGEANAARLPQPRSRYSRSGKAPFPAAALKTQFFGAGRPLFRQIASPTNTT